VWKKRNGASGAKAGVAMKTQGSLACEDAAVVLLYSLVASGQIKLRRIDGWHKIAAVISQHTRVVA
jgi:hypothetical protein